MGIVLFVFDVNAQGETVSNNFIATAFLTHMRPRQLKVIVHHLGAGAGMVPYFIERLDSL